MINLYDIMDNKDTNITDTITYFMEQTRSLGRGFGPVAERIGTRVGDVMMVFQAYHGCHV